MCGGREGAHSQPVVGRRMQPLVGPMDFVQGLKGHIAEAGVGGWLSIRLPRELL